MNTSKYNHVQTISQATTTAVNLKGTHYEYNKLSNEEKNKLDEEMEKLEDYYVNSAIPNAKRILENTEAKYKDLKFSRQCLKETMSEELDMNQKVVLYNYLNPIIKLDLELHLAIECMKKDENWIIEDENLNLLVCEKFLTVV